ncbi:MAG: hypothetical protein WCP86_10465, partial [bacterium]
NYTIRAAVKNFTNCYDIATVTVVDVDKLTCTERMHTANSTNDTTQVDDTNSLYICQTSNDTATLDFSFTWLPASNPGNKFLWEFVLTNGAGATQWTLTNGTFAAGSTNAVWTNSACVSGETNREFLLRAWYDCDTNGVYTNTEPHRLVDVVVVDTPWLMLTNALNSSLVIDTTRMDEAAALSNTLYIGETDASNAVMQMLFYWLPENVNSNWFRWEIELTNGNPTAQWGLTNSAGTWSSTSNSTFTTNPVSVTWTNLIDANGLTNREFMVTGWFDCNTNGTFEADEPHRRLYVTVLRVDVDPTTREVVEGDDSDDFKAVVMPAGLAGLAYAWSWEAINTNGGNNPSVTFSAPNATTTHVDQAHWYAVPDARCASNEAAEYRLWCTVSVGGTTCSNSATMSVQLVDPAAYITPAYQITGSPGTNFNVGSNLWYVSGTGTLARDVSVTTNWLLHANSEFTAKIHVHEDQHTQDNINGFDGHQFVTVGELFARISSLTDATSTGLVAKISAEWTQYYTDEQTEYDSLEAGFEVRAYNASDAVAPDYYYSNCGRFIYP